VSVLAEVKRRNVIKVALAYAAISWLLIQVVTSIEAPLGLPDWFDTGVIVLLLVGFPVALIVAWAFELTPEGIKPTESVEREASITRETGQKLNRITIGVLTIVVAVLLADRFVTSEERSGFMPNSIAVLPFDNLSPDRGDAYFAPGLHEEILNQLEKIQNLTVISRTTMRRYQDTNKTIGQIADELNVAAVMEGSVRYAENVVRVTAQLIDPATDGHLWSDTYERPFESIFAIESEIAMSVANAMAVEFSDEERERIEDIGTTSAEAYALQLSSIAGVGDGTAASAAQAIERIDQAVELDPRSARLLAWKASVFTYATAFFPERRDELLTEATSAANRAVALDAGLSEPYVSLAMVAAARGQWTLAENHFDQAGGARRQEPFAAFNFIVGNTRTAFENISAVRERDPLNSNAWFWAIVAEDTLGNTGASLEAYERGTALFAGWPTGHSNVITTLLGAGDIERALEIGLEQTPSAVFTLVAENLESPDAVLDELGSLYREVPTASRQSIAVFAAYFGDTDLATLALGEVMRDAPISGHVLWRPVFRDVRQQPAFKDLLREYGFVDYWQQNGWPDHCEPGAAGDFICS